MKALLKKLGLKPTWDAALWAYKWSTWLSALQASFASALVAWRLLEPDIRAVLPTWVPMAIGIGVLITAILVPAAVNTVQKKLESPPVPPTKES